ncbi:hypothetical protein P7C70_g3529, partial [Phenoliferia sp. Uapishka_3]
MPCLQKASLGPLFGPGSPQAGRTTISRSIQKTHHRSNSTLHHFKPPPDWPMAGPLEDTKPPWTRQPHDTSIAPGLPVELVKRILELAAEVDPRKTPQHSKFSPRSSYPTLRSAALVSRAWKHPSCEVLWSKVSLEGCEGANWRTEGNRQAEAFVASPAHGTYRTEVVIIAISARGAPSLCAMLTDLSGVKSLEVTDRYNGGPSDFLSLASLKELSSLNLGCRIANELRRPTSQPLPFHLQHLSLHGEFDSEKLGTAILLTSSETLCTLDVIHLQPSFYLRKISQWQQISISNLTTLKLGAFSIDFGIELLANTPLVRHLSTHVSSAVGVILLFSGIKALPLCSLEFWSITQQGSAYLNDDDEFTIDLEGICHALNQNLQEHPALKALEVLYIGWTQDFLEQWEEGRELLRTMDERGIRLEDVLG